MRNRDITKLSMYRKILEKEPVYLQVADRYRKFHNELSVCSETYIHVFAPVLIEYITWVLKSAKADGVSRLYFLARDGYQMYLAAQRLVECTGLNIECRYLNVSRYALRVPEYHLIQEKCLDRICIGGIDVTFEKVMRRAGLDEREAKDIAELCGYIDKYNQVLSYRQVIGLKEILKKQKRFFEYVYKHSRDAYDTTIGYLKQEGLLDSKPYAIVDSGWTGTLQQTLNNLLTSCDKKRQMIGYYFGLYGIPKNSTDIYKAYFFMPRNGLSRKVHFSNCLFEAVFTSTEGMTLSYKKEADKYVPVFDNFKNPNVELVQSNIDILQDYMRLFNEICTEEHADIFSKKIQSKDHGVKLAGDLLCGLMAMPSEAEVEAYGNNQFSDDVLEGSLQKVAAELSESEIRNQRFINKALIMLGLKKGVIHESAWIEGSIVRNRKKVKSNLRHARIYKYFVYIKKLIR